MSYIGGNTNPGNYIGNHPVAGIASSLPNFRNRIINGHLKSGKVINQRGASSITGATGYTFDRWYYDGSTYLYQGIEDANVQNGTYVISWEGSGISAAWKVSTDSTANNGPDATTGFTSVSNGGTFTVNETTEFSKHLWIQFSGTLSDLDKVQVELGTVATPFEHRPYGLELGLCERYFETMVFGASRGITCQARSANDTNGWYSFRIRKRAIPTASTSGTFGAFNSSAATNSATLSFSSHKIDGVGLDVATSGMVAGNASLLVGNTEGKILITAEL